MNQISKISNAIANKISSDLDLSNDKREVIAYGAFVFLQTALTLIIVVVLGGIFNVLVEALLLSLTTSILRKYSGGVHTSSPEICTFLGTVVCMFQAIFIVYVLVPNISFMWVIIVGLISFIWAYYYIYKLAPVDSPSKPIYKEEKRRRLKRASIIVLSFYMIVSIFNMIIYYIYGINNMIGYTLCIYASIWWQVFTLTQSGHAIVGKFDKTFKYVKDRVNI